MFRCSEASKKPVWVANESTLCKIPHFCYVQGLYFLYSSWNQLKRLDVRHGANLDISLLSNLFASLVCSQLVVLEFVFGMELLQQSTLPFSFS